MSNTPLHIPSLGDKFVDYRQPIWGDSFNWSWNRPSTQIEYLVYHHSVTTHDATPDDIALLHKARAWAGIGYHFVITKDGRVWYVGDIGTARANVLNKNEKVIGICMIGDFTKHLPSDEQIHSAHLLGSYLISLSSIPNVKTWDNVVGHKDLQATACPGSSWNGQPGGMMDRIQNNIPYTPPAPIEEVYKVVFKGNTLAEYETNPVDKIRDLNDELVESQGKNGELVIAGAESLHKNNELSEKLRVANQSLGTARAERDTAKSEVSKLNSKIEGLLGDIENRDIQIVDLKAKLTTKNPLEVYKTGELVSEVIKRVFGKGGEVK